MLSVKGLVLVIRATGRECAVILPVMGYTVIFDEFKVDWGDGSEAQKFNVQSCVPCSCQDPGIMFSNPYLVDNVIKAFEPRKYPGLFTVHDYFS